MPTSEFSSSKPVSIQVLVRSITYLAEDINAYEVVPLESESLPSFTAGSHVDLFFRDGRVRQYSLCNDPRETHRYIFAVQRDPNGRGGSKAIHEIVHAGRVLSISHPRNNFSLRESAAHHVLIAGGIGITPLVAMVYRLAGLNASFEFHYGARSSKKLAFVEHLREIGVSEQLRVYLDDGDPSRGMDVEKITANAPTGSHVYCCGPEGLMRAVERVTSGWPPGMVHFERFAAEAQQTSSASKNATDDSDAIGVGFSVRLARSGQTFDVPDDKSIVEVLRENGIQVETSCESGLCGTCRTRYLEGEPDHRDYVLDDESRRNEILICCSRSKSSMLVLDL